MSRARRSAPAASAAAHAVAAPSAPSVAWLDPRAPYLVPIVVLLVTRVVMWLRTPWASEDALITFRYAANWAHGLGPVFNVGEKVFGFTSPPWMAWIAIGIRLGADPVAWSRGSLLVADVVTVLAFGSLLERHASRASAWCFAWFVAALTYFSGLLASGLEMGAMVALVGLTATLIDRRHPAAGAALGLLAIFRPEGLLAALVIALWASWRDRAVAAGIGVLAAIALAVYYGSPVPQSVLAKATVYGAPGPLAAPQWWEWILPLPFPPTTSEAHLVTGLAVLMTPAAIAGLVALAAQRRTALAAAIAGLAIAWLSLVVVGASYFFWYFATPILAWAALASVGLPRLLARPHVYYAAAFMVAASWLQGGKLYVGRASVEAGRFGVVADFLQRNASAGDAVFLEPIGTIGWRNPSLRMIDEVGLVSPAVATRRRAGAGWYTDVIDRERPRWAVIRASVLRTRGAYAGAGEPFRSLDEEKRIFSGYELAAATDSLTDDATLVVLRRIAAGR